MNIACWSGPRNLSTAMMYAFGARPDCGVWDEPFYAAYLAASGADHPMRHAIIAAGETDPARVGADCAAPDKDGQPHCYQKHMTQHMLWGLDQDWFDAVTHVFLIRHPARVLASYVAKRENPTLSDIGFVQQAELYDAIVARGHRPAIVDSFDIRTAPEAMLLALCARIGLSFDRRMLTWPTGGHADDGVWAAHWYGAVHASTGFAGPEGALPDLPAALQPISAAALPHYERLKALALKPSEAEA
ncbi:MAG: HAD family hydrolase [Pseudomonadota bacterium]